MNNFVAILCLAILVTIPHLSSSKKDVNLFLKINRKIQKSLNNVFLLLQLNKTFTSEYKHRLMFSIHANMKTVAENNYEIYKGIKEICELYTVKRPKGLFKLNKLIEGLVEYEITPVNKQDRTSKDNNIHGLKLTSMEIPTNADESIIFLREYLNNVEDIQLVGLETPRQRISENKSDKEIRIVKQKKLKSWKSPTNDTNSTLPLDARRLFRGKHTTIKKFPFIASLHVFGEFVCSGSIISRDMIITAATCLQSLYNGGTFLRDTPDGVEVRIGSDFTEHFGELRPVSRVFFHPEYDPVTLRNNLAILKMKTQLIFKKKNKNIRRIDFRALANNMRSEKRKIFILGWGDNDPENINAFDALSYTTLDIMDIENCIRIYSKIYVNESNICAGIVSQGSGACHRDVGGPGIVGSTLVGVVSFGPPVCGTPDAPTVFTNLGHHIKWINSVITEIRHQSPMDWKLPTTQKLRAQTSFTRAIYTKSHSNSTITKKINNLRLRKPPTDPKRKPKVYKKRTNYGTNKMLPRSVYPKAIQVVTYLLNELMAGGVNIDDIMYDADENESDEIDVTGLLSDDGSVRQPVVQKPQNKYLGNKNMVDAKSFKVARVNQELPTTQLPEQGSGLVEVFKSLTDYIGTNFKSPFQDVIKTIAGGVQNPPPEEKKAIRAEDKPATEPVITTTTVSRITKQQEEAETEPGPIFEMEKPLPRDFTQSFDAQTQMYNFSKKEWYLRHGSDQDDDEHLEDINSDESDNYESETEGGLTIELTSSVPMLPEQVMAEANPVAESETSDIDLTRKEDKETIFLNRNFVTDNNLPLPNSNGTKNDELVVMLLQQQMKNPNLRKRPLNKSVNRLRNGAARTRSIHNENDDVQDLARRFTPAVDEQKQKEYTFPERVNEPGAMGVYELIDEANENARRSILDYINIV